MQSTIVFKVGGSLGSAALDGVVTAIRHAIAKGLTPVVVHGGGPRITAALAAQNQTLPFVGGQRFTPPGLMPIVERVLCDEVNRELVQALNQAGVLAESVIRSHQVLAATPVKGMGRTAVVSDVVPHAIFAVVEKGVVPVVAPVATERATGLACNVNADLAASAIAGAVGAERVVFFTDVDGIYSNFERRELISHTTDVRLSEDLEHGRFEGGMRPKVSAVLESIRSGVGAAFVIHGGRPVAAKWAVTVPLGVASDRQSVLFESCMGTCVVAATKSVTETSLGGGIL